MRKQLLAVLFKSLCNVVLLFVILRLLEPFLHLSVHIFFTYNVFYETTARCFPNFPKLAYVFIILLPHIALFAWISWIFKPNILVLLTKFLLTSLQSLWGIQNSSSKRAVFIKSKLFNTYQGELFRQLAISLGIIFIFCAVYYCLNALIPDKDIFFELQLRFSWILLIVLGLQLMLLLMLNRKDIIPFFERFFAGKGSAYNLAIFRVGIGLELATIYHYNLEHCMFWTSMPHSMRVSLPFMGWFIQNIPINAFWFSAACQLGYILALMIVFGIFTRPALLINIPISIYAIGAPMFFGKLFHQHIWVWFPAILAFSRCGDALSVDWLLNKFIWKKEHDFSHPRYGIPLKMVWMHLGIIYFFAGFVKLKKSGLEWALGSSMINQMQVEWIQHYNLIPAIRIDHYPVIAHLAGVLVIFFELAYPFLVLAPVGRLIACVGGIAMHRVIQYFMYIGFFDLQRTYIGFVNWEKTAEWLRGKIKLNNLFKEDNYVSDYKLALKDNSFKYVLAVGLSLYSINFLFGLFSIHSWPFSSYPTYSNLVPATHQYVFFEPITKAGDTLNIYQLGLKDSFRMESYTPIDDRISENFKTGDTSMLHTNVLKQWNIWKSNVKELQQADTVNVYLRVSPVAPETRDSLISNQLIMRFKN